MQRIARGFSLIELVVVLGLVALITMIAVPSYRQHMMAARRTDAVTSLLSIQSQQEKWRASDLDYATLEEIGWKGMRSTAGHYQLRMADRGTGGFKLEAIPRADGPQAEDSCGTFVITQDGPDYHRPYAGHACWRR